MLSQTHHSPYPLIRNTITHPESQAVRDSQADILNHVNRNKHILGSGWGSLATHVKELGSKMGDAATLTGEKQQLEKAYVDAEEAAQHQHTRGHHGVTSQP